MADRETKANRKKRRHELIEQAMREREVRAAGPELTGPHGVGAPRATEADVKGEPPKKPRLPE